MHARDRVKQLAAQGKTPGDLHARLCDVATAVEILAGELKDVPAEQTKQQASPHETHIGLIESNDGKTAVCVDGGRFDGWILYKHVDGQWVSLRKATPSEMDEARALWANKVTPPPSPPTPQPNLVERLAEIAFRAPRPDMTNFDTEEWAHVAGTHKALLRAQVASILAELAKMPCELPTADEIASLWRNGPTGESMVGGFGRVEQRTRDRVAPILAAKDARIQELESLHAGSLRSLRKQLEFAPQDGDANTGKWILRADVLNAIDAQVSAANVVAGERLETIELQRKRAVDLEAQIAGLERDRRHCVDAISESNLVPPGRTLLEGIGELIRLHRHAKKRFAELETRVAAVTRQRDDEHGLSNLRSYEIDTCKKELADARARIAELEASGAATAEGLQAALNLAKRDHMTAQTALDNVKDKLQRTEQDLGAKNDRVAELEKRLAERDVQYETLLRCKDAMGIPRDAFCDLPARIALLKADHAPLVDGQALGKELRCIIRSFTAIVPRHAPEWESLSSPAQDDWHQAAKAFLRKVGTQSAPLVDGKTPGQVMAEISSQTPLSLPLETALEIIATGILRAFGNSPSGQTPTTNAVEVLRDLKSKLPVAGMYLYAESVQTAWLCALIDDQIALLEGATSAPTIEFPTIVASKDVIRGSYFCTAISLRPFLHIGHDVGFDDIPRLLNLGRNDVIEIRVVQRAKQ